MMSILPLELSVASIDVVTVQDYGGAADNASHKACAIVLYSSSSVQR